MKTVQSGLQLSLILFSFKAAAVDNMLKPETLEQLSKKLGYRKQDDALADYLSFAERIEAGFATPEWIESCKANQHESLCLVLEEYFEFIKKGGSPKPAPKSHIKQLGTLKLKKIAQYQSESFQSLLNALPSRNTKFLLSFAKEAAKTSACPQNLSLALGNELERLAGDKKQFPLIEKLYKNGVACANPSDSWFELGNLRLGLIYLTLKKEKEAVPYFKRALEADHPREDYRSLYWLAHTLKTDNPEESEKYFNSLLDKYPRSWYTIVLLNEKGLDPLKMNLRESAAPDTYTLHNKMLDTKFTWLKMGLLLEKDPYKLKKYAEYIGDQVTPNTDYGFIQHMSRLLHSADLYKAQIGILNKYLTLANPPVTKEVLEYLYPAPFLELFNLHGVELDTALLLGLARQESSFDVRAKSGANAWGLLQLLPSTAKHLGSKKSEKLWGASENIRFASKYLIRLAKRFNNSIERSLAAYNAGPSRVEEWEKDYAWVKDPVLFVDLIPYRETRDYVPTILRNAYWYHRLYPGALNITKQEYVTSGLLTPLIAKYH